MSQTTLQKHISRLMALLLSLMLLLPCIPTAFAAGESGTCGGSLTWSFDGNTLTISGSGAMTDYSTDRFAPWYSFRNDIYQISLPDGLTRVGNLAFYDCTNITSVVIPGTVTDIGELAFCQNRSMTMLTLNNGLRTIGRSAFERCESLKDLRIPGTVTTIGKHAFYVCSSLTYVTVPASVTSMGSGVFAYCDNLARVDVEASIEELPFWTFYGCEDLNHVSFGGETLDAGSLKTEGGYSGGTSQTERSPSGNAAESVDVSQQENGQLHISDTTTTRTENTTVSKTENYVTSESGGIGSSNTEFTASVVNPEGWNEVVDQIQSAQNSDQTDGGRNQKENSEIVVTIFAPADNKIPSDVLKELAGSNVILNITTQSGSKFIIDCAGLEEKDIKKDLDLSYTLTLLDAIPEGIESALAYQLAFGDSSNINVEMMIRLPMDNVRRAASLYQPGKENGYDFLQSVVVDNEGYAHYYLGAIDQTVEYLIAMDVQGEQSAQAIVPDNLYDEYRLVDHSTGKEYVITGRTSSWNMGLGKVMAILAVVMVSAIVVIGFVMYFWNKQRLKNGYVPKWEDEEE